MDNAFQYLDTEKLGSICGLRERKRMETLAAIEDCATRLVLERGFDAVTVDDICEAADISKRTFFNYVDTKETAVLGLQTVSFPDHVREEFLAEPPRSVLIALVELACRIGLQTPGRTKEFSMVLLRRHKEIMHAKPDLLAATVGTSIQRFHSFAGLVEELLEKFPQLRSVPNSTNGIWSPFLQRELSTEALTLTHLAQDATHIGSMQWMQLPTDEATEESLTQCCLTALEVLQSVATHSLEP